MCSSALGGEQDSSERYVAPMVVTVPDGSAAAGPSAVLVLREEIFGPVLPIVPVASAAPVIEIVNRWDKPSLRVQLPRHIRNLLEQNTSSGSVVHNAGIIWAE